MNIHGSKKQKGQARKPTIATDDLVATSYAQILYGLCEGEIAGLADDGKSIRLENTPLINDNGEPNFEGVSWEFRTGTLDQTHIAGFPSVENEYNIGVELRHDRDWTRQINNRELSAVRVRLNFNALKEQKENGDITGYAISYAIDVQTDGGSFVEVLTDTVRGKASQGYKKAHRIDLPNAGTAKRWTIRVRRITPNRDSELVADTMSIDALTEIIDAKLSYPCTALLGISYDAKTFNNIAKIAVRLKGKIIQVPSNYNAETRQYNGLWDGSFKFAYSNNPAWVFYDLCTHKRYGLGERLSGMVDKWRLYQIGQYCDELVDDGKGGQEPRFTCNVYIQKADDAYRVLQNLASVFRGLSFWDGQNIVVDSDTPKDPVYTFSPANVVGGEFSYTGTRARDRHTLSKVAWDNPENNFTTEYELIPDEEAIAKYGVRTLDISAFGCTSKGQAQRAGIWALKSEQLETQTVTFKTGLQGFIPQVGQVINIADNVFAGRAISGRIVNVNGKQITLDRMAGKIGDILTVATADGIVSSQITAVQGEILTLKQALNIANESIWAIISDDLKLKQFRILTIAQNDDATFDITALEYNRQKYAVVDNGAMVTQEPFTVLKVATISAPKSVALTAHTRTHQGQAVTTLNIAWEQVSGAVAYIVEWRKDDGNWQTLPKVSGQSVDIDGVYAGVYQAKVRAIDAFDNESLSQSSQLTNIAGKHGKPPRPINLSVQGVLFGMNLGWNFAKGSGDTNYTEIQVSPDGRSNIATLGTFAYPTNKHEITGLQGNLTQFYRARIVDKLGNTSDWTAWASGTTSANADKVLDILSGQISQSHLDQSLRTPIGKIGTLESNISGINSKIPTIESNINSFNSKIPSINKIPTLEQSLSGINRKIPTIESNISSIISRADTINSTLNDANNRLAQAAQSITNIDTRTQWQTLGATSLNSLIEQGKYYLESSFNTNTPLAGWQYATVDKARGGDRITQTVWNDSTKTYTRTKTGDAWGEWVESVDKTQLDNTANQLTQSIEQTSTQIRNELATKATTDSVTSAIRDINALQTANNAKTQEIANLTQTVNGHTSQVRELGVTTGDLSQKYSQLKTTSDTANSEITAIKQTQSGQAASVERLRSEMADKASSADLQSVQRTLTSKEQSLSQRINTLQSDYNGNKASVQSSISTLTDANRTQAQQINQLNSEIYSPNLLQNGDTPKTASTWNIDFPITETLQAGRRVYISLSGASGLTSVAVYNSSPAGAAKVGDLTNDGGVWRGEFNWVSYGDNNVLQFYREPRSSAQTVTASLTTSNGSKIANLERTLTTTNQSLSERIGTVESSVSGNTSSINTLNQSLTTTERALTTKQEQLTAQLADKASSADLQSVQQTLATKERALTEQITTAKSELGGRITQISDETRTLSDANRTIGEQINQLNSEIYSPNLLQNGDTPKTASTWNIDFPITETLQAGRRVYISLSGASGLTSVAVYNSSPAGAAKVGDLTNDGGVWRGEFNWVSYGDNNVLQFYREPRSSAQTVTASLTTSNGSKIANLERTLTTTNQSLSERIGTVESSVSGNTSSINTLNQSLTTTERALTTKQEQLTAQLADKASSADLQSVQQTLATKERALTEQITTAKSELGGRITQISDETRTLSDANRTIGEQINQLNSEIYSPNLLQNGDTPKTASTWNIDFPITETLQAGRRVYISLSGASGLTSVAVYNSSPAGAAKVGDLTNDGGVWRGEFNWVSYGDNNVLQFYREPRSSAQTVTASLTTSNGSKIANLERTLTTTNQSLSERINTVQTTLNGQAASIQQHAQSLNSLSAQWTLKVQSGGVVSGIGLASNNGISDFAVIADKFYVASPQGDKKPMFTVTTRPTTLNGTTVPAVVSLNGDLIGNGTISGDKIRANTQITAPNIRGGSINIGNNFSVDNQGNLNANSGVFRGQVFADKITGQIDVESLKSSAVALGYDMFFADTLAPNRPSEFDRSFKSSYASYGSIIDTLNGAGFEKFSSVMYEIRVFCKRAITVKQKLYSANNEFYCFVNNRSIFGESNTKYGNNTPNYITVVNSREISLSLRQGLNTIQFIVTTGFNPPNSAATPPRHAGGRPPPAYGDSRFVLKSDFINGVKHYFRDNTISLMLVGDFIDNNIIKFA